MCEGCAPIAGKSKRGEEGEAFRVTQGFVHPDSHRRNTQGERDQGRVQ